MTTTQKRRGKRPLAAILAAMLMASVLAVVAGSPAHAANTSDQVLIDHDDDPKTDKVREFAGQDRYDTALKLAKSFATAKGGLGAVSTVFISSGDTLVDSISVAGLAGYLDAPILLTRGDSLHGAVADFLEDYNVNEVYVLGGQAAVSDAVLTAIEGLDTEPQVERLAGADRYETAAKIASEIATDASWCGTSANSAVLINGDTEMLAFGVAIQTTAFKLQLPVLMTAADMLPESTADFIEESDIEHVQIVGDTSVVSAEVAAALTASGVDTVDRIDTASASDASVELAKMANNGCGDALGSVSQHTVALVRGNPDGVVAAPTLVTSADAANGLVVPLIVGDTLPAAVSDYLAATPKTVNGDKLHLGILAIGGTSAVSEQVMKDAIAAAESSGALTVSIAANTDVNKDGNIDANDPIFASAASPRVIALYFSDDVPDAGAADADENDTLIKKLSDVIEVNGVPAQVTAASTTAAGGSCLDRRIDVTLAQALSAGDKISIADSSLEFGTNDDKRTVASAQTTVLAVPKDRTKPSITVVGIAGQTRFEVHAYDEKGIAASADLDAEELRFTGAGVQAGTITRRRIGTALTGQTDVHKLVVWDVAVVAADENPRSPVAVKANDRLEVRPGAVADTSDNVNSSSTGRAIAAPKSPRVSRVYMSEPVHKTQNSWTMPGNFGSAFTTAGASVVTVSAKPGGDAAGAVGNGWSVLFDVSSGYSADKPMEIDVRVDTKGRRASVRWVNGKATLADLLEAMRSDDDFSALFNVSVNPCSAAGTAPLAVTEGDTGAAVPGTSADTGRTQFAIEVHFGDYIRQHTDAELLNYVLARTVARNSGIADRAALITALTNAGADVTIGTETVAVGGGTPGTGSPAQNADRPVYGKSVRYEMTASDARHIPVHRDLVDIPAGANDTNAAAGYDGPTGDDAVTPVALGYAADDADTTKVREDYNGKNQPRIEVTSRIKARN